MPKVFKQKDIEYNELQSDLKPYAWYSSPRLSEIGKSKDLFFNMRKLDPDKYSYPYHYHHNAEELLIIMEGSVTLRTSTGLEVVNKGDILFFEKGDTSEHQLYNHTSEPCIYFDLRTNNEFDVAEFTDSNKMIFGPAMEITEKGTKVDYFKGEENIAENWNKLKSEHK
jgi:uncharacterized cupin superfamily protein